MAPEDSGSSSRSGRGGIGVGSGRGEWLLDARHGTSAMMLAATWLWQMHCSRKQAPCRSHGVLVNAEKCDRCNDDIPDSAGDAVGSQTSWQIFWPTRACNGYLVATVMGRGGSLGGQGQSE